MAQSRDEIRQEIEERRAALQANLSAIEARVRRTTDLGQRIAERPLTYLGASVAAGMLLGGMTGRRHRQMAAHGQPVAWTRVALTALAVDILYDVVRNVSPRVRASLKRAPLVRQLQGKEARPMASPKENLIAWLKDAHALESNVIQTLERHIDTAKDHPHMQVRLREHLQESRRHADLVEACLSRYGENTSGLKETIGAMGGVMQGLASMPASDTLVKNALGDYAAEHFEIACYRSLITAARFLGDNETAHICEGILRDEERMAAWLEQQIPLVTQEFLGLQARQVNQ